MPPATPSPETYRFGVFEANPHSGELLKKGARVHLQDKPFRLLILLLQAEGNVVSRDQIRACLWPEGTFVEFDDSLNAAVKKLRTALGDSSEHPRFLQTVPKIGYRFIAPVSNTPGIVGTPNVDAYSAVTAVQELQRDQGAESVHAEDFERNPSSRSFNSGKDGDFSRRSKFLQAVAALSVVLALIVLSAIYYARKFRPGSQIRSLAVLPLENLSGDPQQQYFVDGMTDELITTLAKVSSLSVISRTSAMQYRGAKKPLPAIGRELNVDAVVEGSVERSGERVRVSVQLIDARNDRHLWAESYDYEAGNLVQLQSDIATAIAGQIRMKLSPGDKQRLARSRPVSSEAHEAYLKGLYFWNERTTESLKNSITYFEEAIRKDPNYALAYSGLADAYDVATDYDLLPPRDSYSKGRAAALKALELDADLAQAHATLGDMKAAYEWDWSGAEAEFKRALELNPGYATAHHWYAQYLTARGRFDEALAEMHRAMELDPLSPSINAFTGSALFMSRKFDESAEQLSKMTAAEPAYAPAHYFLGFTREKQGRPAEAVQEFKKAVDLSGGDPSYLAALGYAYGLSGNERDARAIAAKLQKRAASEYVSSYDIALVFLGLNEKQRSLDWLNRAYEEDDPNMNFLNVDPVLDELRSDSRFQDLLRRIGLRA